MFNKNSLNLVTLIGRISAEPKSFTSKSGSTFCRFTVVTNQTYTSGNETKDLATFIPCIANGATATYVEKAFAKGTLVNIVGNISYKETKLDDGTYSKDFSVRVDSAQVLYGTASSNGAQAPAKKDAFESKPRSSYTKQATRTKATPIKKDDLDF